MTLLQETERFIHPSIPELVEAIDRKDDAMRYYKDEQRSQGSSFRHVIEDIRRDRSTLAYRILERRTDSSSGIEVNLIRYPNEEYHPFSQNRIRLKFGQNLPHLHAVNTNLDLLANSQGSGNSLVILSEIGDIDSVEDETNTSYLQRTHDEIRVSEKRYAKARAAEDMDEMVNLSLIRKALIKRLMLEIRTNNRSLVNVRVVVGNGSDKAVISTAPGDRTFITMDDEIDNWVRESGGIDGIDTIEV